MDAEALRDTILTAGGGLDLKRPYGSQVSAFGDNRVGLSFNQDRMTTEVRYRSVYLPILRDDLPEALGLFDFADPSVSKPKRESTNVPIAGPLPDEQQMGPDGGSCHGKGPGQALP